MRQVKSGREVAAFTKSLSACDVNSAFRCCKIRNIVSYPFCGDSTERVFFYAKIFS